MSIQADDTTANGLTDDDAVAALLGGMSAKPGATKTAPDADDEGDEDEDDEDLETPKGDEGVDEADDDEADDDEEDNDGEKEEVQEKTAPAAEVSDDTVVKITVDGEEQELTVGSLKRLAGQEASLTRKSQEADLVGQRAAATLQGALETVLEDLEAYRGVDWVLEARRMEAEEFEWHREQYTKLMGRREQLLGKAQNLESTLTARQQEKLAADAAEAVKVLSDPAKGIPGWSDKLYEDILSFAVSAGLPEDEVATIVNPTVIKIINDARLYREGQKTAVEKVNLTPKKVRQGSGREAAAEPDAKVQKRLEAKVRSGTATDDDAMAALMGRWGVKSRR